MNNLSVALAIIITVSIQHVLAETPTPAKSERSVPNGAAMDSPTPKSEVQKEPSIEGPDLRALIGVNPGSVKRVDVPKLPAMTLRGFAQPRGQPSIALLEIAELNRIFLVHVGTEIPIMVQGRLNPLGHSELTGLSGAKSVDTQVRNGADPSGQSQIILKVLRVTGEGVTVEAGLLAQTIIIR